MENLPSEITSYILSRLPLFLRLQCREVCRTWRNLVPRVPKTGLLYGVSNDTAGEIQADFYFSQQVSTNHVDDDEQLNNCLETLTKFDHSLTMASSSSVSETFMVGSCNGLVCYANSSPSERKLYICNPLTGEQIQLPAPNWKDNYWERGIGFGCSRSSKAYKVVRILVDKNHHEEVLIQVYTVRYKWNSTLFMGQKHILSHFPDLLSAGIFAGGALHWVKQDSPKPMIVAFDLEHHKFNLLASVPSVRHDIKHVTQLMDLGGNLGVLEVAPSKHVTVWEWEYKKKYRSCDTLWVKSRRWVSPWVSKFSIAWEDYSWFDPSALTKSADKHLLWYNVVLSCYDPETNTLRKLDDTLKKLKDDGKPSVYSTTLATPHVNSLVSLKAVIEEGRGKKRRQYRY